MKSRTMKATLAFLTASAAVVGLTGPTSAASIDGQTYSFPLAGSNVPAAAGDAGTTGGVSATVNGANLDVTVFVAGVETDIENVVMHFHDGATCDAAGAVAVNVTAAGPVPVVHNADLTDASLVHTVSVPLGAADMENVYYNVHDAANPANVIACGELDATDSPLLASPESKQVSVGAGFTNASDINAGGGITLEGTRLQINLEYSGDDLLASSKHMLMLRSTPTCTVVPPDTYLLSDNMRAVTSFGSSEMLSATLDGAGGDQSLTDVFNNTFWTFTAAAGGDPDKLNIDTELVLTPAEAAQIRDNGFSFVLHGNESNGDGTRPAELDGLTVGESIPANCVAVNSGLGAGTALSGNYYALEFAAEAGSNIAGNAYLKNTTAATIGSVELITDLSAESSTDNDTYFAILHEGTCDALAAPFGIGGDNPDLGSVDGNTGRLRTQAALSNSAGFTGDRVEALNDGEYVVVITNNAKDTAKACASMGRTYAAPAAAPAAPVPDPAFSGTVAQATTLDEILMASDYRANATNTGTDQEIMRLYQAFFGRDPDVAGVQYWISVSKGDVNGTVYTTLELAGFFPDASDEFANQFEGISNQAFVEAVYQNVLERQGEASGVVYWNDILDGTNNSGNNAALTQGTRADVVYYVAINQEFINREPYAAIPAV